MMFKCNALAKHYEAAASRVFFISGSYFHCGIWPRPDLPVALVFTSAATAWPGRPVGRVCVSSYPARLTSKPELTSFTGELGKTTYLSSAAVTRFSTQALKDSFSREKLIPSTESVHVDTTALLRIRHMQTDQYQILSYIVKSYFSPAEPPPPPPSLLPRCAHQRRHR